MNIDRKLKLIIPFDRDDGTVVYVHASLISAAVFDQHYEIISQTFNAIYTRGIGLISGPRVADKVMRDVAKSQNLWDGPNGVKKTLFAEMLRLTNVAVPGERGWETRMYEDAKKEGILYEDECSEIEGALTFFTVLSSMHKDKEGKRILKGAMSAWDGQTTSLDYMAFLNSLPTLSKAEPSMPPQEMPEKASSPPPSTGCVQTPAGKPPSVPSMTILGSPLTNSEIERS